MPPPPPPPPPTNSSCAEVTTLSVFQNASPARASCRHTHKPALTWQSAFAVLLVARTLSAVLNIIHDCDEVYNYWEPLHYLLYGYGKQTWEYRYWSGCDATGRPRGYDTHASGKIYGDHLPTRLP